ncbi:MAG: hypothetical protein HC895_02270 [Leptolyngbyaceae cyanobacterium SM1_3_5]|nr:hypothetical protein [Leptolyngbyaceae cyanobacterium SM1_3_5]
MQIALAIADQPLLRSLLLRCLPAVLPAHQLGAVTAAIGVPIGKKAADGVLTVEQIYCILADSIEAGTAAASCRPDPRSLKCESELQTLGQSISLAQAIVLLQQAQFSPAQAEEILHLSSEGWHKSWWYSIDADGNFTVPFLRQIRTLRYANGRVTLQYKDRFEQDKPPCFRSQPRQVLVEIETESQSFRQTLEKINYAKAKLGIQAAILICDRLSELEVQGFVSQQISIYSSTAELPVQADCQSCAAIECPLHGYVDSPVIACRQYCVQAL